MKAFSNHFGRGASIIVAGVACCAGVSLLAISNAGSARATTDATAVSASGCSNNNTSAEPRCFVAARLMPRAQPPFKLARPGTTVRSSRLVSQRVFLNDQDGVALASSNGAQYPALSTDGGRRWQIAGPPLHVDAAQGAEVVSAVGIASTRTFFAYGTSVVDVTTDGGRDWWQSFLGESVVAASSAPGGKLVALVEQPETNQSLSPAEISQYVSTDGGRQWRYSKELEASPGIP